MYRLCVTQIQNAVCGFSTWYDTWYPYQCTAYHLPVWAL